MLKNVLFLILINNISTLVALEYSGQKPSRQQEKAKTCSNGMCTTTSYWGGLIKLSCDHYFCGTCAQKSATKTKGKCAFCNKVMFDVSNIPTSLKYELLLSERDEAKKPKQQSGFGGLIQDAFKIIMPNNPLVQAAPNATQMFTALALARRYKVEDCYEIEPEDSLAPIEKNKVMNEFWLGLENVSPEQKEQAVKQLNDDLRFSDTYHWWRIRIAAAAHIGANVDVCEKTTDRGGNNHYDSPLIRALRQRDEPLVDLLLSKNVSVKTPNILWDAFTRNSAQKLVDRGANVHEHSEFNENTILESVMQSNRFDADLVHFYMEKGLSGTAYRDGLTPLHRLAIFHEKDGMLPFIAKFQALIKDRSSQGIVDMLADKTKTSFITCPDNCNALEILEGQGNFSLIKNWEKVVIYCYLLKVRDDALKLIEENGSKVMQLP